MDPIIACSSGRDSNYGVAILRISGFDDIASIYKAFEPFAPIGPPSNIQPRKQYFAKLLDGESLLDEVLFSYFPAPNSYTGENVLELSVHGNQLSISRILDFFCEKFSMRLARPGEFTRRALKNKKLDLTKVEGIDLFLNAKTKYALEAGIKSLSGEIQKDYEELYQTYLKLKASIEIFFDFLEDVGEESAEANFRASLEKLNIKVKKLFNKTQNNLNHVFSPEIVVSGPPNAGKSTLFNLLLNQDRAIVSNIKGTTRDYISENFEYGGTLYRLIDTAGIRETDDEIEKSGISLALDKSDKAFFKILLINPKDEMGDFKLADFDLVILSHGDSWDLGKLKLLEGLGKTTVISNLLNGPIGPKLDGSAYEISGPIEPEVKLNKINDLPGFIGEKVHKKYASLVKDEPNLIPRQREKIKRIYANLSDFNKLVTDSQDDLAIISSELNRIGLEIEELIGVVQPDDVLNYIFSNFCIGK